MKPNHPIAPTSHFCVWFVSGTTPGQLRYRKRLLQISQDVLVVAAQNEHDALEKAAELLRLRCEYPAFVTLVLNRAELLRSLAIVDLVDAGKLAPATCSDDSHLEWAERFVYTDYTSPASS
jgi:hypothetical protein